MKRWVQYAKEVDWSVFLGRKAVVVTPAAGGKSGDSVVSSRSTAGCSDTNVVIIEEGPTVVT
jgi:hypothetical protein